VGSSPGCRDVDVQVYNDCVNAIDGVNLCEYVIQDPKRRPRTHFANNFLRARNDGQRIDHVIVSREVVQKTASLKFTSFYTLQTFGAFDGTSDHCPLYCSFSRKIVNVFLEKVGGPFRTPPIVSLRIQGVPVDCLLDTGSPVTILNPAENKTSGSDFLIGRCASTPSCNSGNTPTQTLVEFDLSYQQERANGFTLRNMSKIFQESFWDMTLRTRRYDYDE